MQTEVEPVLFFLFIIFRPEFQWYCLETFLSVPVFFWLYSECVGFISFIFSNFILDLISFSCFLLECSHFLCVQCTPSFEIYANKAISSIEDTVGKSWPRLFLVPFLLFSNTLKIQPNQEALADGAQGP